MRVFWSPLALEKVDDIAGYIARDNRSAAEKWVNSLFAKAARLNRFPGSGRIVPEMNRADIREIIEGNYRVIYRVKANRVDILTVRHAKQNLR